MCPFDRETDQQAIHQMALPHDDLAHLRTERIDEEAFALDAFVEDSLMLMTSLMFDM